MATRKQKVKVGIFLAVCLALIAAMVMQVTGLSRTPGTIYWMEFDESVLGLYEGGMVEYLGVPIGKVHDISVVPASKMRGRFNIDRSAAAEPTAPGAPADYTIVLGNTGDEEYHIVDVSSQDVYDGPRGMANPEITLIPGKRYAITVIDAERYPIQILSLADRSQDDSVLLAQGDEIGAFEGRAPVGWRETRDGSQGTVTFTLTQNLLNAMSAGGSTPGYRCPVQTFRAHVDLLIDPGTSLHQGIQGQIVIYSLAAGTMAISLSGGDAQAPVLEPNAQIPTKPSIVAALSTRIENLVDSLTSITQRVETGLEGLEPGSITETVGRINKVLDNAESLLAQGETMLGETTATVTSVREDARRVIDEALVVAQDVQELMESVNRTLEITTAKIESIDTERTQEQLSVALDEMGKLAKNLNDAVSRFDELSAAMMHEGGNVQWALRNALAQVAQAFDALRHLLQQVKDDPASLIRGPAEPKESGE